MTVQEWMIMAWLLLSIPLALILWGLMMLVIRWCRRVLERRHRIQMSECPRNFVPTEDQILKG